LIEFRTMVSLSCCKSTSPLSAFPAVTPSIIPENFLTQLGETSFFGFMRYKTQKNKELNSVKNLSKRLTISSLCKTAPGYANALVYHTFLLALLHKCRPPPLLIVYHLPIQRGSMKIIICTVLVTLLAGCASAWVAGSGGSSGVSSATIGIGSGVRF